MKAKQSAAAVWPPVLMRAAGACPGRGPSVGAIQPLLSPSDCCKACLSSDTVTSETNANGSEVQGLAPAADSTGLRLHGPSSQAPSCRPGRIFLAQTAFTSQLKPGETRLLPHTGRQGPHTCSPRAHPLLRKAR